MHWAAHGKTAAGVIAERADATKPNMGLTSWAGPTPRKAIAKNYLDENELDALNKIVIAYLDFAEVQALNRKPMYMTDWLAKLDDFLNLGERDVLTHAGSITHAQAVLKAEREFETFATARRALPSPAEKHFDDAVKQVKQLERAPRQAQGGSARSDDGAGTGKIDHRKSSAISDRVRGYLVVPTGAVSDASLAATWLPRTAKTTRRAGDEPGDCRRASCGGHCRIACWLRFCDLRVQGSSPSALTTQAA